MTASDSCVRVIQISDCHLFADIERSGYLKINPYTSLQKVLACVRDLEPELVLVTGDLSGDLSESGYRHFQTLWQQAGIPAAMHIIPGNHDQPALLRQFFGSEMSWLQRSLKLDNWHLHALDSHYQGTLGYVDKEQLSKLKGRVNAAPDVFHLVAVHHHPVACNSWMDKHQWCNREAFLALLDELPQIRLVIHGHVHADLSWQHGNSQILACPSTCWQWRHTEEFAVDDKAPGLRLLELGQKGTFNTRIIRVSNR
ncbi:metallophosphoesterase family protein [Lacimicrobium alkaliphilum]|uniref:Calcineurin-like phosphoesterase domain-containing protein n=1 Tax=Lacimicrobium alkaliphilum TaxID=1526571 RepID=A0A0U3AHH7_9ALTE|nr:metallophosphoesterase [Lacimicrobium alkaliphilum]ALS97522.1 hypothetical protein AT746_04050 [Lacimicrobium alkaliphilum]